MEYRNELKFELPDYDFQRLYYRLLPLMQPDRHQGASGYLIRSLYFDDLYDSCMAEKENGVPFREKYRIRIYDNNPNFIRLEKKTKYADMTKKTTQPLTFEEYQALLSCRLDSLHDLQTQSEKGSLLEELILGILRKGFSPKCIVEYERFAFTETMGNVRVTFDRNVAGSAQTDRLFDSDLFTVPVMPQSHHILEVKYDELLPHYLLQALDLARLQRQSFSKYYLTRAAIGRKEISYGI